MNSVFKRFFLEKLQKSSPGKDNFNVYIDSHSAFILFKTLKDKGFSVEYCCDEFKNFKFFIKNKTSEIKLEIEHNQDISDCFYHEYMGKDSLKCYFYDITKILKDFRIKMIMFSFNRDDEIEYALSNVD